MFSIQSIYIFLITLNRINISKFKYLINVDDKCQRLDSRSDIKGFQVFAFVQFVRPFVLIYHQVQQR